MTRGQSIKGYKMTKNRTAILEVLVGEDGAIRAKDGTASRMLQDLIHSEASPTALNATLRSLEDLGFIVREIEGKRTYEIRITPEGRKAIGAVEKPAPTQITMARAAAAERNPVTTAPVPAPAPEALEASASASTWDWDEEKAAVPGDIDYDILLGVFLKAALRGMETPVNNDSELNYYKQQNELAVDKIQNLEKLVEKLRTEAGSAIAERDQIQKNMNVIMAKLDKRPARGTSPIRNLLSPSEQNMLDSLMKQVPTRRGE